MAATPPTAAAAATAASKAAPASAPAAAAPAPASDAAAPPKMTHAQLRDKIKAAEREAEIAAAGAAVAAAAKAAPAADAKAPAPAPEAKFERDTHVRYFASHLTVLPAAYLSLDHSRMHVVYFALESLDMLDALPAVTANPKRLANTIDWIYNLQLLPPPTAPGAQPDYRRCGFRGATIMGQPFDPNHTKGGGWVSDYDESNMAMTYTALTSLRILGDDLSRVNRKAVIGALRALQQSDGSFTPTLTGGERDMRFVYCACVISALLNDWSGFDLDLTTAYIVSSQSYDGGFGLGPDQEGHGGSTYTALASLALMGRLDALSSDARARLLKWAVSMQGADGYRGRPNKPCDCCYSFWVAAVLHILGAQHLTAPAPNRAFNLRCQSKWGGFSKHPGTHPDVLHAHFGLAGLSLIGADNLKPIDVTVGLTLPTLAAAKAADAKAAIAPSTAPTAAAAAAPAAPASAVA